MDSEKKYNNALERAKQAIEDCGGNQGRKKMIYGIFPELAEGEDEKIRKWLIEFIVAHGWSKQFSFSKEEVLAWIEKQKEQKPAEWSEEDELMRNRCIADFGYLTEYDEPQYKERYDAQIGWLKSLRPQPHWKPSEEQMEVLFTASERNDKLGTILNSLYHDLKKL